jgi:hypothetical protein
MGRDKSSGAGLSGMPTVQTMSIVITAPDRRTAHHGELIVGKATAL